MNEDAESEINVLIIKLAAAWLEMAADEFGNHGCNDIPREIEFLLTPKQWDLLNKEYQTYNKDNEKLRIGRPDPFNDSCWMGFLAKRLKSLL